MATINLGRVRPVYKGDYLAGTAYTNLDIVKYNGALYIALQSTTGNLPTDITYWAVLSPSLTASEILSALTTVDGSGSGLDADLLDGIDSTAFLQKSGGTMTGPITSLRETSAAMSTADIDLNTGNLFSLTVTANITLTVSNVPASGQVSSFILDITNGGSQVVTWFTGVKWPGGTAPTLTTAGRDVLGFLTYDGGTTWSGFALGLDVK